MKIQIKHLNDLKSSFSLSQRTGILLFNRDDKWQIVCCDNGFVLDEVSSESEAKQFCKENKFPIVEIFRRLDLI